MSGATRRRRRPRRVGPLWFRPHEGARAPPGGRAARRRAQLVGQGPSQCARTRVAERQRHLEPAPKRKGANRPFDVFSFSKFIEKYNFYKTFYLGTQYESKSARNAVHMSAKSSLREQMPDGVGAAAARPAGPPARAAVLAFYSIIITIILPDIRRETASHNAA